jgi:hypothetical protein
MVYDAWNAATLKQEKEERLTTMEKATVAFVVLPSRLLNYFIFRIVLVRFGPPIPPGFSESQ